jgi:sulfatase modifying factor 1
MHKVSRPFARLSAGFELPAAGLAVFFLSFWLCQLLLTLQPGEVRAATPAQAATSSCDAYTGIPDDTGRHAGMLHVLAGSYLMGDDGQYHEEAMQHEVRVNAFWIDRHDVTNAQFARFVEKTGYVTLAERKPDPALARDLPREQQVAGSAVFIQPANGRPGRWQFVAGANWRHPHGPGSSIEGKHNHPVVQIAYEDALAYARWLGRTLPTEAQWEYAARGGLEGQTYVWGNQWSPAGKPMANTWQGAFPIKNEATDGYAGTSPVGCFPANNFGLYDMAGNVWQWTRSIYSPGHANRLEINPEGPNGLEGIDPRPGSRGVARVIKGGSHLCAPNYCRRYRPSARQPADPSIGTTHIGFRTVSAG